MEPRHTTPAWDDLRAPASAINPAGSASAAAVNQEDGSLVFVDGSTNSIAIQFQMPHNWLVGSDIYFHVHWCKTTSAVGTVKWQYKYKWTNIGSVRAGFSGFLDLTEVVVNADTADLHALASSAVIAGAGKTMSSIICIVLQRLSSGGSADTYNDDVKLFDADIHYQVDGFGSRLELVK